MYQAEYLNFISRHCNLQIFICICFSKMLTEFIYPKEPGYLSVLLVFGFLNRFNPSSSCETENIEVYDGASPNSPLLGQVCNNTDAVPVFQSSSNSLTFLITTNSVDFTRNFFVFYYFFSPETGKPELNAVIKHHLSCTTEGELIRQSFIQ